VAVDCSAAEAAAASASSTADLAIHVVQLRTQVPLVALLVVELQPAHAAAEAAAADCFQKLVAADFCLAVVAADVVHQSVVD
jgi:hypothetical protein